MGWIHAVAWAEANNRALSKCLDKYACHTGRGDLRRTAQPLHKGQGPAHRSAQEVLRREQCRQVPQACTACRKSPTCACTRGQYPNLDLCLHNSLRAPYDHTILSESKLCQVGILA